MSGAVMLLMAATVGITYGWTPDGGDGVKYIIQIPPEKMEQVARSGEISSQIPTEIRGHVSEVVIRVGEGNVPRVTPGRLSSRGTPAGRSFAGAEHPNAVAAADQIPIPIPSMGDPTDLRPIGARQAASTAMMKPAPQSGGMNMPGGFGRTPASNSGAGSSGAGVGSTPPATTGYGGAGYANAPPPSSGYNNSSLEQAAREAANNAAKQFNATAEAGRQQIQQNINATAGRMGDAANDQMQSAANSVQDAAKGMIYGPAPPPSTSDDPRRRLTQGGSPARPSTTSTSAENGPSTAPHAGNASLRTGYGSAPSTSAATSSANPRTPPSFASSQPSTNERSSTRSSNTTNSNTTNSNTTNSRTVSTPPLNAATKDEDWYAMQNGSPQRPSTAPQGNSAGSFTGGNFAQLPSGLQPTANSSKNRSSQTSTRSDYASSGYDDDSGKKSSANTELDYDPNLSRAQAAQLPKNGYSYDAEGYPVDRQGYRVDRHGRRVDRQGNLLTAADAGDESDANTGESGKNTHSGREYAGGTRYPNNPPPRNSSTPPLMKPPRDRIPASGDGADHYSPDPDPRFAGVNGSESRNSRDTDWDDRRPRPGEDALGSASDGHSRASQVTEKETVPVGGSGESVEAVEQVEAQPIFNVLLLLSVVGNAYLLYWLKNLRVQFRDMVAAKRASATGGSLAAGA